MDRKWNMKTHDRSAKKVWIGHGDQIKRLLI